MARRLKFRREEDPADSVVAGRAALLRRERAPATRLLGAVVHHGTREVDEEGIRCHVCGEWFQALATHVVRANGFTSSDEYREEYGLSRRGLVSAGLSWRCGASARRRRLDPPRGADSGHAPGGRREDSLGRGPRAFQRKPHSRTGNRGRARSEARPPGLQERASLDRGEHLLVSGCAGLPYLQPPASVAATP